MKIIVSAIKDLVRYRYLVWDLAIKDIKIRYRSPILGFLWSILIPLIMVLIFKFVFSSLLKAEVEKYPFFIYLMTAIFPWTYFVASISSATDSILSNRELIKKTYFPRQVIPVSVVLANLINFLPAMAIMLLMLACFRVEVTPMLLLLPVIILFQTIFTIGLALILSSLQVILRDVKYIVELLLMAWLYLSPGFYSLSTVSDFSKTFFKFYLLNPFVGFFCLYRISLLKGFSGTLPSGINIYALSLWVIIVCILLFLLGFLVFKKYEPSFFDLV